MGKQLTIISKVSLHDRRRLLAEELLKSVGINPDILVFKGQGTYNTVFKGTHPKPTVNLGQVALRVSSGPKGEIEGKKAQQQN